MKFVYTMFLNYLNNEQDEYGFRQEESIYLTMNKYNLNVFMDSYKKYIENKNVYFSPIVMLTLSEYVNSFPQNSPFITVQHSADKSDPSKKDGIILRKSWGLSLSKKFKKLHEKYFENFYWVVAYIGVTLFALYKSILKKFKDKDWFIVLIICNIPLLSAVIISMVGMAFRRYSYTTEICYYISAAFILQSLWRNRNVIKFKTSEVERY
ncbi:membrane protein [Candidatus Magnetobacterium bavaricum]|uniref:Membrane protein n=1 Tax=Candidatus Magnetobacterium bavaricum TaxID=29290 RepID=A0A0F3GM97_9BACT|nr:membrane protein [Candidatus Magnetobacterium bavaricum]